MTEKISTMETPSFSEEDDRIPEMDKMWLLEKEQEMFVEWQMQEDKLPARLELTMPKLEPHEVESDTLPF